MADRRFQVVVTDGSGSRNRLVVDADGPLAAAVEGFLRSSGSLPETVVVDPVAERSRLGVTVTSAEGTRFHIRVSRDCPS